MDIIYIHNIKAECIIGVWDWERRIKQAVFVNLDLGTDISKAAKSDELSDTLDYKSITKQVKAFIEESSYQLVETLAENIAQKIISDFGVTWVRVKLNKRGALRDARDVGVIIERKTDQA